MSKFRHLTSALALLLMTGCATRNPYVINDYKQTESPTDELAHTIMFFGGADKAASKSSPSFVTLTQQLQTMDANSSLVLLGNNGAKRGLTDSVFDASNNKTTGMLSKKLEALKQFKGSIHIVPGNHDWANGGKRGYRRVLQLESFVEDYLDREAVMPVQGCPGPYEVELNEGLLMIFLNTQWWLHQWEKGSSETGCNMESEYDFIVQLDDLIKRNINKNVVVVGHHPMFSNGPHGGYFSTATHLLPPVLGSIYAWYRKTRGGLQDLADTRYRIMRKGLQNVFAQHPNLVYLSGHERSQQYHKSGKQHYIISGAIANATPTTDGNNARFSYGAPGFGKLNFYQNGDTYLEFWTDENGQVSLKYREKLFNHSYKPEDDDLAIKYKDLDYSGQTKNAVATTALNKDQKRPGLMGKNYRAEWGTEIQNVPVFDLGKERGGFTIVKKGGGLQTKSLRLQDKDGKQYVLRSIEKFPEKAVPQALRGTIAGKVVEDQVSASHPYGAFVVPKLASAAGIYHTNPKLVYLPDDPRLGIYRADFAEGLYLYEERPAKDRTDISSFGNSKKIINTLDVLKKTQKDDEHYVDQEHVLRSRLFDIWIGDWDRHDDQWRWSSFKDDKGFTFYRPVPRDRDQAFFWSDGTMIKAASHKWGIPKFQGFHKNIRDLAGLEFNARYFDRSFLNQPSLEDWVNMAKDVQGRITDEVIEGAIKDFPPEIFKHNGNTIIEKLKARRQDLHDYAKEMYLFLSKEVDVVGSKKAERFEIDHKANGTTEIKVFRIKEKSGEIKHQVYERVFKKEETKEIRLFGLGDDDRFIVTGNSSNAIKVRIIGGKGHDIIEENAKIGAGKTIVYDKKKNTTITAKNGIKDKTSDKDDLINEYNRYAFKYDKVMPLINGGFNPDDGLFIGGGVSIIKNKFRKDPFGIKHNITASIAPRSGSYNVNYTGHFTEAVGSWDLLLEADVHQPSFADFFYGFGNKTMLNEDAREEDNQFYRARYGQLILKTDLQKVFNNSHSFKIGAFYRMVNIEEDFNDEEDNRFIINYPELIGRDDQSDLPLLDLGRRYIGTNISYGLNLKDSDNFPTKGVSWNLGGKLVSQLGDEKNNYQSITTDFSAYFSFGGSLRTTLAVRVGGQANFGDFEFYQAARLGGLNNLRGYRRGRFAGDESFYQNTDLRIKLLEYRTPLFPGSLGITLLHDIGRVWTDQEDTALIDDTKAEWHRGIGGGIWIAPLGQFVLSADYTVSNDDEQSIFIRFGFFF